MRGGQSGSRKERTDRVELLPRLLLSHPLSHPHRHRQACRAPRVPGTVPHRGSLLPHSSHRISRARVLGFSARFACDLHTSATTPTPTPPQFQTLLSQRM